MAGCPYLALKQGSPADIKARPDITPPSALTLYTSPLCPYAHRIHLALLECNITHTLIEIDLKSPRPDWFLEMNPEGKVPVLKVGDGHGELVLRESLLILEFLADLAPQAGILVGSPVERAQARSFVDVFAKEVITPYYTLFTTPSRAPQIASQILTALRTKISPLLAHHLSTTSGGIGIGPFFNAAMYPTYVEYALTPFLLRLKVMEANNLIPSLAINAETAGHEFAGWCGVLMEREGVRKSFGPGVREVVGRMVERIEEGRVKEQEAAAAAAAAEGRTK
ncbi:Glutathione S-transferase dhar1, mitochondrial [Saitoella coloradoensis]